MIKASLARLRELALAMPRPGCDWEERPQFEPPPMLDQVVAFERAAGFAFPADLRAFFTDCGAVVGMSVHNGYWVGGVEGLTRSILRGDFPRSVAGEERIPYVWLTEYHRCRRSGEQFEYPEGIAEKVTLAIHHHVTTNRHHPEFHADPNDMSDVDLIEMVCDWTAMAEEFGQDRGSARGWADKTVGKRVAFNAEKRTFIYRIIDELDKQIAVSP
jgi:hypothetical protein